MNAALKYDILKNHNDYDINTPRTKSEQIINDPFDLGNTVKGLTYLNHKRNLSDYALELVGQYAKYSSEQYELSLDMVPEEDQNELARLYIESIDREIEWACYGSDQSINSDYLCALLAMLQDDCEETRQRFAEVTRKNIIVYYTTPLQEIIDDACHNYLHSMNNESGYYANQDTNSGEIYWRKF